MRVGGLAPAFLRPPSGPNASTLLSPFERMSQYRLVNSRVLDIKRALQAVQRIVGSSPLRGIQASSVTLNGTSLGLDEVGVRSTRASVEQVNNAATSIGTRGHTLTGVTFDLDGTYDGAHGDDTYRLTVTRNSGAVGDASAKDVRLHMTSSSGATIGAELKVGKNSGYTPGDRLDFDGISVTLGAGSLVEDDSFTFEVRTSVGSAIARDKRFNGVGNDDAVLEDLPGGGARTITTGSFLLNDTTIIVNAADTLDDVLSRINDAATGVTASYDDVTELVTLTDDNAGPDSITLSGDDSGLLAALKLSTSSTQLGQLPDPQRVLSSVSAFFSVGNGTITINDQTVDVTAAEDTLEQVLAAINDLDGVTATFVDGRVTVTGDPGVTLAVADTSGFLAATGIATGTHVAVAGTSRGLPPAQARDLARTVRHLAEAVDAFLADQLPGASAASSILRMRTGLASAFTTSLDQKELTFRALGGMAFDFTTDLTRGVGSSLSTERRLARLLEQGDKATLEGLLGDGDKKVGLLKALTEWTRKNLSELETSLGGSLDLQA